MWIFVNFKGALKLIWYVFIIYVFNMLKRWSKCIPILLTLIKFLFLSCYEYIFFIISFTCWIWSLYFYLIKFVFINHGIVKVAHSSMIFSFWFLPCWNIASFSLILFYYWRRKVVAWFIWIHQIIILDKFFILIHSRSCRKKYLLCLVMFLNFGLIL